MAVENLVGCGATTTQYEVEFEHTHHEGIFTSPVGGEPPQNASVVRLHAPFEMLTVIWACSREGAPPDLPSHKAYLTNPNRIFLGGKRVGNITPSLGCHIFSVSGFFRFAIVGPEDLDSNFPLSACPWETALGGAQVTDYMIPETSFLDTGIINPSAQPTGLTPPAYIEALELQMAISP